MFAQLQIPQNAVWYDAVQVVVLIGLSALCIWLAKRSIDQGVAIAEIKAMLIGLQTTVTNHHKSRLERLRREAGIEWKGSELEDE